VVHRGDDMSQWAASMEQTEASPRGSWKDYLQPGMLMASVAIWLLFQSRISPETLFYILLGGALVIVQGLEFVVERHARSRLRLGEFMTDLFYTFVVMAIGIAVYPLVAEWLWMRGADLGLDSLWPTSLPFLVQVFLALALAELGQYWLHRLMHVSPLWRVHGPHHHITQLNAWKGNVGQPIELLLIQLSILPMIGAPLDAQLLSAVILIVCTTFSHANVAGSPPIWFAFFFTTHPPHSLHHRLGFEETRCNYANGLQLQIRSDKARKSG
jgi:sterol desaturase/sphingolipid hydroxylase (fatty acid hydroxylase superfamily)